MRESRLTDKDIKAKGSSNVIAWQEGLNEKSKLEKRNVECGDTEEFWDLDIDQFKGLKQ